MVSCLDLLGHLKTFQFKYHYLIPLDQADKPQINFDSQNALGEGHSQNGCIELGVPNEDFPLGH